MPFRDDSPDELARLHQEVQPPPLRELNPNVPATLEQIVLKVLSKEPAARYRTADQLGRVLVNFRQQPLRKPSTTNAARTAAAGAAAYPSEQTKSSQPVSQPGAPDPAPAVVTYTTSQSDSPSFDWLTWLLALLALIAAGGLIPFWLWIFYILNPPV